MRALLVDPSVSIEEFITEISIDDWRGISPAIGEPCQMFTSVRLDERNTLYVDDEGLYNGQVENVGRFGVRNYPQLLAGRGVILGTDAEGESVDCDLTLNEAKQQIGFLTPIGPVYLAGGAV